VYPERSLLFSSLIVMTAGASYSDYRIKSVASDHGFAREELSIGKRSELKYRNNPLLRANEGPARAHLLPLNSRKELLQSLQPVHVNSWRVRSSQIMLALLFGAISLLYATVGQAGGTSFLALMTLASFSPGEMRPTALMLNIVASSYSTWLFNRRKFVDWAKLSPLLVSSLPTDFVGGLIVLDERSYKTVTGLVLLSAAIVLALRKAHDGETDRPIPLWGAIIIGAAVGFVSGLPAWVVGSFSRLGRLRDKQQHCHRLSYGQIQS
jgi:hypothetical protein